MPLKIVVLIAGLVVAAVGGVIAYRALFLEPAAAVLVTASTTRDLPNGWRVAGGIILVASGAAVAFLAARRMRV